MAKNPHAKPRRPGVNRLGAARRLSALAALVALLSGCGGDGIPAGTAFDFPSHIWIGARAMPPGAKIGFLADFIQNHSGAPLRIDSVVLKGPGIGTVARVAEVKVAPPSTGKHTVPESLYVSDPPVKWVPRKGLPNKYLYRAGCYVQPLHPVKGYVVQPGQDKSFRFWVVIQMLRPGRWSIPDHVVYYTQAGTRYRQVIRLSYYGSVARKATWPSTDNEWGCLTKMSTLGSRVLNPGHTPPPPPSQR